MAAVSRAHESLLPDILVGNILVAVAAVVAVALRVVARRLKRNRLQADDAAVFVALPLALAIVVANLVGCAHGLGRHVETLTVTQLVIVAKAYFAAQMIWAATVPLIKISILLFYVRVLGTVGYVRVVSYCVGVFSACLSIAFIFVLAFACIPFEYNWNKFIPGECVNQSLFFEVATGINVATDLVILLLPAPVVWKLHVPLAEKLQVAGVFLSGSLTCAVSLARWVSIFQLEPRDATWNMTSPAIWSAAEACLGIVSSCLLTLKPLVQAIISRRPSLERSDEAQKGGNPAAIIQLHRFSKHEMDSYHPMESVEDVR